MSATQGAWSQFTSRVPGLKFLDDDVLLPKFDQGQGSINPVFIAPDQPVWVIKRTEILPKIKL